MSYGRKTKIPNYMLPLDKINPCVARIYCRHCQTPKLLVELCCDVLDKISGKGVVSDECVWQDLKSMLACTTSIITDTYCRLCQVKDVSIATKYVKQKSALRSLSVGDYLSGIKVIRIETTEEIRRMWPENHWKKMSPKYPSSYVLFGRSKRCRPTPQIKK